MTSRMYVIHLSTLKINLNKQTYFIVWLVQGSQEKKSVEKCPHINNRLDVQPAYVIKIDTNTEKKWERIHPSKNRWQHNREF